MIQSQVQQSKFQRGMEKLKGFLNSESNFSPLDDHNYRKTKTPLLSQQQQQSSDLSDHETHEHNVENNQIGLKNLSFLDEYQLGDKLGEGTNGIVHICWLKKDDSIKYAVKIIASDDEEIIQMVKQSFINSQLLKSPYIAKCYKLFIEQTKLYLLMEWVPFPNLEKILQEKQRLQEKQVQQITLTLLKAIKCLHKAGICHRDIKPDNIQIQKDFKIKLIDFGVSRRFVTYNPNTFRYNRNKMLTITGNIHYRAPEIYRDYGYDSQVDLWAIGIVVYQCLTGILPYSSEYIGDLIEKLSLREQPMTPFQNKAFLQLPTSCRDFIKRLLMWNPLKRLNASEALKHIWIPTHLSPNRVKLVKDDIDISRSSQNSDLFNKNLINSAMILNQELANTLIKSRQIDAILEEETPRDLNKSLEVSVNFTQNQNTLKQKLENFKQLSLTQIHRRTVTLKLPVKYINTITILESEKQIDDLNPKLETSINITGNQVGLCKSIKDFFGLTVCESQVSLTQIEDLPDNDEQKVTGKQIDSELLQQLSKFEQ